eukprot:jgi/Chrpa1/27963/Chrysochromulina_OHIO_Genome00017570-RA
MLLLLAALAFSPSRDSAGLGQARPAHSTSIRSVAASSTQAAPLVAAADVPTPKVLRPEVPLQVTAFIFVLGLSLVTLTPTTHFISELGQKRGMAVLTAISSTSAAAEIVISPILGGLSDAIGRKTVLLLTLATATAVNFACALSPTLLPVGASKFVSSIGVGLFFLAGGAALADNYRDEPKRLAAASGPLFALVNLGFGLGIALSALLPPGLRVRYGASSVVLGAALATATCFVRESLPQSQRVPFRAFKSFNPFACVRLLCLGRSMRLLALLAALNVLPLFMGDTLQAFAITHWHLGTRSVSQLFSYIAVSGVLANMVGGQLVRRFGVQTFTALSTGSALLMWLGFASGNLRAALVCAGLGLLGPARTLGATTMLTSEGARLGIPQGQLAGDRANLIAWIKIIGPLLYGQAYMAGMAAGVPQAPFFINVIVTLAALGLGPMALAAAKPAPAVPTRRP